MPKPRILTWDIEATQLNADFGAMLCVGYKWLGEPMKSTTVIGVSDVNGTCKTCATVHRPTDDKALLEEIYPIIASADGWITWFGKGFDERFVNTRLLYHGMKPLPPLGRNHIDGWYTARYKLKLHSNRLASVQSFLGLSDAKTSLYPDAWLKAIYGDPGALNYITHHCYQDVKVLEQAYLKLLPLISVHPNSNLFSGLERPVCPNCGSTHIQYRGTYYAETKSYPRFQCQACGKWGRDVKGHEGRVTVKGI